jgi:hypothetical protein
MVCTIIEETREATPTMRDSAKNSAKFQRRRPQRKTRVVARVQKFCKAG